MSSDMEGEFKNWMLEQPANNKVCSSIQGSLYPRYKKVLLSFLELESSIPQKIRKILLRKI